MQVSTQARSSEQHTPSTLPADPATVAASYEWEAESRQHEQVRVPLVHTLHGGIYTRTARMPQGTLVTSVLIKIQTTLIVFGDFSVLRVESGEEFWDRYTGCQVFVADAGRRMVYACHSDTTMSMAFPTKAATVDAAEREFTDEIEHLQSVNGVGDIVINTHKE